MKENSIIVTDSGLGGMLIAAELFRILKKRNNLGKTKITFFNALFDRRRGYNSLKRLDKKVKHFDLALSALSNRLPNLVIIACNTLSVLYPYTSFSKSSNVPVVGMTQLSRDCLREKLKGGRNCSVVILATPTTTEQGNYGEGLSKYKKAVVIEQACPGLVGVIEGGNREQAKQLINQYAALASQKIEKKHFKTYISLNCTHFGYYQNEFKQAFLNKGIRNLEIINPNSEIVKSLKFTEKDKRASLGKLSIEVFSKTKIRDKFIKFSLPYLNSISPETAVALKNYHHQPDLF